jgi:hypothetical protein
MLVASDEATAGSVMAKQLLISPRKRGSSHCCFCSSVPYLEAVAVHRCPELCTREIVPTHTVTGLLCVTQATPRLNLHLP